MKFSIPHTEFYLGDEERRLFFCNCTDSVAALINLVIQKTLGAKNTPNKKSTFKNTAQISRNKQVQYNSIQSKTFFLVFYPPFSPDIF